MKNIFILFYLLLTITTFGQESGDLRFNSDTQRSEIYINSSWEETELSSLKDTIITGYRIVHYEIKGWYGIDSLYAEHGDYFTIVWNTYDLGFFIRMRKIFDVLLEEKLFKDYYYFYINGRHDNR